MSGSLAEESSGSKKQQPAATRHHAMLGKVKRRRFRRPKVSIVLMAGMANTKVTSPKPNDANKTSRVLLPVCAKTVEE